MRGVLKVVSLVLVFLIVLPAIATARPTKKAPPKRSTGPVVYDVKKVDERWAMQDGAQLPVSVYSPVPNKQGELFPAIVFVHPWDIDKSLYDALAAQYASRGYVGVTYTVRGWFGSDGEINCIDPDCEVKDLSNIITLALQDTRFPIVKDSVGPVVGVIGYSMGGVHSFLIAPRQNPGPGDPGDPRVRAVVPMHGGADLLCSIYPKRGGQVVLSDDAAGRWLYR